MKMVEYSVKLACSSLLLLSATLNGGGCVMDQAVCPIKVKHLPNSFKARPLCLGDEVVSVEVSKCKVAQPTAPEDWEVVWLINAVRRVPVSGFIVTVGEIPEGFEQVVPLVPERFSPTLGEEYSVRIDTDCIGPGAYQIGRIWEAD